MLVKLYLSLFLSSKLIVFRQESKSKFESVVSEPSTSTSSLIYKRVSDDSASRKAPSKFDTNLVLYTQILPSAGPQSSRDSNATSSQRRRSFRPNYSHPVEARVRVLVGKELVKP